FYKVDDVVQVGKVIATIEIGEPEGASAEEQEATSAEEKVSNTEVFGIEQADEVPGADLLGKAENPVPEIKSGSGRFYSPLVRSMAAEEGISQAELDALAGSGLEGRVTKQDVLDYIKSHKQEAPGGESPRQVRMDTTREPAAELVKVVASEGDE